MKLDLQILFERGLIPGPDESEEEFLQRIAIRSPLKSSDWEEVSYSLRSVWGFGIDWVPISYSSKGLLPWEGAVFLTKEKEIPQILFSARLKKRREEILAHEAVHAAREAFNEPIFEEFLAYTAESAQWKRLLGPLFSRSWEFPLFAVTTFFLPFFPGIGGAILLFFIGRLIFRQTLFSRAKKKFPMPVLLCLTDREIQTGVILPSKTLRYKLIELLTRAPNE